MSFKRKTVPLNTLRAPPRPGLELSPKNILQHCGVRPSTQLSIPAISTGSTTLDDVLGHTGLPLGSVLLVEESGNTDFASVILRSFAAIGILQSRVADRAMLKDTKVICLGVDASWGTELPGTYVDKREKKKLEIEEDKAKVTVGNLATESERQKNKIAWRYSAPTSKEPQDMSSKPYYSTVLDYKTRLRPGPSPFELEIVRGSTGSFLQGMLNKLNAMVESHLKKSPETVIRIIIPSFLHPTVYPSSCSDSSEIIKFVHGLATLVRKYNQNVAIIMSMSLELYPREIFITKLVETLVDGLIHIDPFPESLSDSHQGLVHIYKLPLFSERGQMVVRKGELAFRVGRKSFEISEWGIPVEEAPASQETDMNKADLSF